MDNNEPSTRAVSQKAGYDTGKMIKKFAKLTAAIESSKFQIYSNQLVVFPALDTTDQSTLIKIQKAYPLAVEAKSNIKATLPKFDSLLFDCFYSQYVKLAIKENMALGISGNILSKQKYALYNINSWLTYSHGNWTEEIGLLFVFFNR